MSKIAIKNVAISVVVYLVITVITFLSILYVNDFRYNREDGLYKVIVRAGDLTEEEREERHLADDYRLVVTHIGVEDIGYFL